MFCVCFLHMIFFVTFCLKLFLKKNWSFCYGINNSFRGSALLNSPSVRPSFRPPQISCPMHILFPLLHLVQPGSYFTNRVPLVKKKCSYFEWTLNHVSLSEGIVWIIWNILGRVISSLHWPILAHTYRLSMVKRVCSDLEWYL